MKRCWLCFSAAASPHNNSIEKSKNFSCSAAARKILFYFLILLALATPPAFAKGLSLSETSRWERQDEGLPSFAFVLTLACVPEHPETLYAGTYLPPGLWYSTDGGETWQREGSGQGEDTSPHTRPVFTLLWDARRRRWWAGTDEGLFFRSEGASSWQAVSKLNGPIYALALDRAGHLYAVQADDGLYRLEGSGRWKLLRKEPRALTAGISPDGTLLLGTAGNGLWLSYDGGKQWTEALELWGEYIANLLVDPEEGSWMYVSTLKGVYRSEDSGHTWQPVSALGNRAYAFALASDGTLYVGMKGCVARSEDGGRTWAFGGEGLPPKSEVTDILIVDCAHRRECRKAEVPYILYIATRDGVYRSTDRGQTWQRHRAGLGNVEVEALSWDGKGGILAATKLGLYRQPSGAKQWEPMAPAFRYKHIYALSCDATCRTIYAGMESGLLRSTDGGLTWEEVPSKLNPLGMPGVLADPLAPDHLFIRLAFERIYESHDGGRTWEALWDGMETYHVVLSMARSRSGTFLAGTQDGLFQWDEGGKRWQRIASSLSGQSVFALAFDPQGKARYAGATDGLWCSSGEGQPWHRCGRGVIEHTVTALAVLPGGHVYAGTQYAGLYRSCDGGITWHPVPGIPAEATVKALLVDAEKGIIYAATDRGLFRGTDAPCPPGEAQAEGKPVPISEPLKLLNRLLSLLRGYPPARPYPAVHTLRADDAILRQATEVGFRAIVQVFSWREIEPTRGEWHWEYPDFLVQAAEFYGLDLIARLDQPPDWALWARDERSCFPFDTEAYLRFVGMVAQRYRGRIKGYIIWNEPNLALEWGAPPNPAAYARLLQKAYETVKKADPFALVISAGLAPTNEQSTQAMDDRVFLEEMYKAGARPFFDVLGAHPYGFAYPPEDPHGAHKGLNMNRLLDLRAIMEAHQDGAKPVWATEIGWTTYGLGEHSWLTVTPEEQADYLVRAWRWAKEHSSWLHLFTVWNLSSHLPEGDEKAGYSILYEDGKPKPAYWALRDELASEDFGGQALQVVCSLLPDSPPIPILAEDEEVHLGDSE